MATALRSELSGPERDWSKCVESHNRLLSIGWSAYGQLGCSETDLTKDEYIGSLCIPHLVEDEEARRKLEMKFEFERLHPSIIKLLKGAGNGVPGT
jgi:hypothetical protein